jgi:hypothetical protein
MLFFGVAAEYLQRVGMLGCQWPYASRYAHQHKKQYSPPLLGQSHLACLFVLYFLIGIVTKKSLKHPTAILCPFLGIILYNKK